MRLGVLLSTFRVTPTRALDAAAGAVELGLDGVFCYDHLWPMGSPERPAIAPFEVLAAVATRHPTLRVGPLVARAGLVSDEVLLSQCRALRVVAEGRIIIGLGTGDKKSREENLAYGVDYAPPDERRQELRRVASALVDEGTEVWIGAGSIATSAIAAELGCTLNCWQTDADDVVRNAELTTVSWAGSLPTREGTDEVDEPAAAALLGSLVVAGSTWAVLSPGTPVAGLALARELLA
jgi:alkanesulfonate monooxygenase SsuD/methylene tetrahydromethanopterin reductase-like flavin-dependent oxidoreductase (luciferase family)